jgi:hypothetical protein
VKPFYLSNRSTFQTQLVPLHFGADTNTNNYDADVHVSRAGAGIPLMLQHYWWSEECFVDAGLKVGVVPGVKLRLVAWTTCTAYWLLFPPLPGLSELLVNMDHTGLSSIEPCFEQLQQ